MNKTPFSFISGCVFWLCVLAIVSSPRSIDAQTVLYDLDLSRGASAVQDDSIRVSGGHWDDGWRFEDSGDRIVIDAGRKLSNGLLEVWFTKRGPVENPDGVQAQWLSLHEQGGGLAPEYAQLRAGKASYGFSKMRAKSNEKAVSRKSGALTNRRCEVKGGEISDWITDDQTVMHTAIRWQKGTLSFTIPGGETIACTDYWQYPPPYIIDSLRYVYLGSDATAGGAGLPGLRFKRVRLVDLGDAPAVAEKISGFGEKTIRQGETTEWTVNNPGVDGNPFDVVATAQFRHDDSGQTRKTEMFCSGKDQWAFRFHGTDRGRWSFKTVSKNAELDGLTGSVTVERGSPGDRGFVTNIGSKWAWSATGTAFVPQYVMGKDLSTFYNMTNNKVDRAKIDAEINEFIIQHGFTGFHLQGREAWFNLGGKVGDDPNPDARSYQVIETIIEKVYDAGGTCHLWMWGADGKRKGDGPRYILGEPMNDADKRNLRYLAARLGALPGWTMGYGFDTENMWASREELDAWKSFLEAHMGWDHVLGSRVGFDEKGRWGRYGDGKKPKLNQKHNAPIGNDFVAWSGGDYVGYTSYRPLYERYVEAIEHQPGRPSFEEDRFRLREAAQWTHKDYDPPLMLKGLWHSAMAGGVANIWGNLLPDDDRGGSQSYDSGDVHIKDQIKTYATFFRDRFAADLIRDNSLADAYSGTTEAPDAAPISVCLRDPAQTRFLFYKETTDRIGMELSQMREPQPAIAVDVRKPYAEIELGMMQPGQRQWQAPYRSTWAIAVGKHVDD